MAQAISYETGDAFVLINNRRQATMKPTEWGRLPGRIGPAFTLAALFFFALYLRVEYINTAVVYEPIRSDAAQYYACAWNLVHHGVFSMAPPGSGTPPPDSFRDPGLPALIAAWLWLTPDIDVWYGCLLMTQAVLSSLTVLFIMLLARRCLPLGWVIATGVIAALWPHNIVQTSFILSETLTGFLLTGGLWVLARATIGWTFALSGAMLGLAGLSNAVFLPFPIVLTLVLHHHKLIPAKSASFFLLSALCLPLAWTARNASLPPSPDGMAGSRLIGNLIEGSHPEYLQSYQAARVRQDPAAIAILEKVTTEQETATRSPMEGIAGVLNRFAESPLLYLKWYFIGKPTLLWGWQLPTGQGDLYQYPTMHSPFVERSPWRLLVAVAKASDYWWAILMFGTVLMLLTRRPALLISESTALALLVPISGMVLVCYTTIIYSITQAEPRYVIAIRGFEFMLAILMLRNLVSAANRLRKRTGPATEGSRQS